MISSALPRPPFLHPIKAWLFFILICCTEAIATSKPPGGIQNPGSLMNVDIGSVGLSGSANIASSGITVQAAGNDIYTGTDSFNFTYQSLTGNGEIILRVDSLTNINTWTKAGVMVRRSLDPSSANVALLAHPEVGISTQIRPTWGQGTSALLASDFTMPGWLKLVRQGNNVKTFSSENGICWTQHSNSTLDLGSGNVFLGVAVASLNTTTRTTAAFGRLAINNSIGNSPQCLASGLVSADVGNTGAAGSAQYSTTNGNTYTVKGAGAEVNNATDAFHFVHSLIDGDGQITAKLDSVSATDDWTKAGIMIRSGVGISDPNAFLLVHPKATAKGAFQHRSTTGAGTAVQGFDYFQAPLWLRLVKKGTNVSAYISHDGICWKPKLQKVVSGLTSDSFIGLAVTSRKAGHLATATFSHVEILDSPEIFNADCDRAKMDVELPQPTNWKIKPGLLGGTSLWEYTTTNPNSGAVAQRCPQPRFEHRLWVKTGPDDADCPDDILPSGNWASTSFSTSWPTTRLGAGNMPVQKSIANTFPTSDRIVHNTIQPGDSIAGQNFGKSIWFRRTFSISNLATEKDSLMLWGRWNRMITVYINGVRATHHPESDFETDSYRYLGISKAARAALRAGNNVIGVRVEADQSGGVFFDMGITRNSQLANLPHVLNSAGNLPSSADWVSSIKAYLQEQGIPGATFAWSAKRGTAENYSVSATVGYQNKGLTTQLPANAVMRLASADKPVSDILIRQIMADPDYAHFNLSPDTTIAQLVNDTRITLPVNSTTLGWGLESFTLRHLLLMHVNPCWRDYPHNRVVNITGGHEDGEPSYSYLGISKAQFTADSTAEIILRQPCHQRPSVDMSTDTYMYNNDAKFLLRYFAAKVLATRNVTIQTYFRDKILAGSPFDKTVVVAHEALTERHANEPAYMTRQLPKDRSLGLENYYALATTADAYLYMLNTFDFCDHGKNENIGGLLTASNAIGCGGGRGVIPGSRAYSGQSSKNAAWQRSFVFILPVSYDHFTNAIDDRLKDIDWDVEFPCAISGNLINNCDFASGVSNWSLTQNNANARLIGTRRAGVVEISQSGTTPESVTLSQLINVSVPSGNYSLKFRARVDGPFDMVLSGSETLAQKEEEWARTIKVTVINEQTNAVLCQSSLNRVKVYMGDEFVVSGCQIASNLPANRVRINFHVGKPLGASDKPISRFFLDTVKFHR